MMVGALIAAVVGRRWVREPRNLMKLSAYVLNENIAGPVVDLSEEMAMSKAISILAASTLVAFFAATDTSFAATKKQRASGPEAGTCLGGGCNATNPDRNRPDYYSSYYKRSSKSKKSSDKTDK